MATTYLGELISALDGLSDEDGAIKQKAVAGRIPGIRLSDARGRREAVVRIVELRAGSFTRRECADILSWCDKMDKEGFSMESSMCRKALSAMPGATGVFAFACLAILACVFMVGCTTKVAVDADTSATPVSLDVEQVGMVVEEVDIPAESAATPDAVSVNDNATTESLGPKQNDTVILSDSPVKYVVVKGDSVTALAQRFEVSVDDLVSVNKIVYNKDLNWFEIYPGMELLIPVRVVQVDDTYCKSEDDLLFPAEFGAGDKCFHVVPRGDTVAAMAKRTGVSASAIASRNHLRNPSVIRSGALFVIPGSCPPPASPYHGLDFADKSDFLAGRAFMGQTTMDSIVATCDDAGIDSRVVVAVLMESLRSDFGAREIEDAGGTLRQAYKRNRCVGLPPAKALELAVIEYKYGRDMATKATIFPRRFRYSHPEVAEYVHNIMDRCATVFGVPVVSSQGDDEPVN